MAIYTKEQFLAYELAKELDDKKHFGFYVRIAKRYSAIFLLGILGDLKQMKNWSRIKRKGAYFNRVFFSDDKFYNTHFK
jgi:hypothetical protein